MVDGLSKNPEPAENSPAEESFTERIKKHWLWLVVGAVALGVLALFLSIEEEQPGSMIDIEGMALNEARAELRELDKDLEIIETDHAGDDRRVVLARNWKVCAQSTPAGEYIFDEDELEVSYTRVEEDCEGSLDADEGDEYDADAGNDGNNGSTESSADATVLGTMPDLVGMTVADANDALLSISYDEMSRVRTDITGADRSIWDSDNWIVCSQSIAAGDDILSTDTVEIAYDRPDGGCLSPEEWVETVDESWSNPRDDISIESMSSDTIGSLVIHIESSTLSDPEIASWAESGLDQMINLELPGGLAEVNRVKAYRDGQRLRSDITTEGLTTGEARAACDRHFESMYPTQETNARWLRDNLGQRTVDDGSAFQISAGGTIGDTSVEVVCRVGGSSLDDADVLDFEVR